MGADTSSPPRSHLTVSNCQENVEGCPRVDTKEDPLTVTDASSSKKYSGPLNFNKLMKEASLQEFFEALDCASAEDLDFLLRAVDLGGAKDSLTKRLGNGWRHIMTVPTGPRSLFSILQWWESRRAFYNGVVGSIGMLMAALVCWRYQLSGAMLIWALLVCMVYAIVLNLCYSLGLPAELIARSVSKFDRYGPILFTLGLTLSIIFVIAAGISMLSGLPGLQG